MSIVQKAFDLYARAQRRGFKTGRMTTVGASEIGQCARKIKYIKSNTPHDDGYLDGWGAARRGVTFEKKFFVPAMRKHYGDNLLFTGAQQQRYVDKYLSATPDGLLINQPRDLLAGMMVPDIGSFRCVAVECKTIDPRVNLSEPKSEHVFQVHVQLGMYRKLTKYKPDYGVLVYTNASFFDDTVEFVIKFDPKIFANAEQRAQRIMQAETPAELKPEGWIAGGDECRYCPFAKSCGSIRHDVPGNDSVAKDPQFIAELVELAQEERAADSIKKSAEAGHRELQEKIKSRLREKGLRFVKARDISVTWSAVKGRPSYDWPGIKAAAAAAGIDLQSFETVGDPSDRLNINVRKVDRLVK